MQVATYRYKSLDDFFRKRQNIPNDLLQEVENAYTHFNLRDPKNLVAIKNFVRDLRRERYIVTSSSFQTKIYYEVKYKNIRKITSDWIWEFLRINIRPYLFASHLGGSPNASLDELLDRLKDQAYFEAQKRASYEYLRDSSQLEEIVDSVRGYSLGGRKFGRRLHEEVRQYVEPVKVFHEIEVGGYTIGILGELDGLFGIDRSLIEALHRKNLSTNVILYELKTTSGISMEHYKRSVVKSLLQLYPFVDYFREYTQNPGVWVDVVRSDGKIVRKFYVVRGDYAIELLPNGFGPIKEIPWHKIEETCEKTLKITIKIAERI